MKNTNVNTETIYELIMTRSGEIKRVPIIKAKEGSKTLWKVQAPKGILTFTRKRDAIRCQEVFYKEEA